MQRHHWMSGLLLLVLAGAFSEVGRLDFVLWDDDVNVYENPYLHPVTLRNVLWFWRQPYFSMYIPVTRTVWAGLGLVSGLTSEGPGIKPMDPSVFHLANLAVHALNALLVFTLLRKLVANDWACCAGALLFGLHPVQVEPVAWVTGMKDLLGGLFALVALWGYLTHAMRRREGGGAAAGRAHYVVATVAFALALLSKPSAVVLPVVAWVLDRWALKRPAREVVWALAPWVVLAIAAGGVAAWAEAAIRGARTYTPIWARPFVAGDALAFYLYKLLVPLRLGSDYGRTPQFVLGHAWGYLTWLAPCVLGVLLWARRQAWPLLGASAGVFVAGLLPVLGLTPFAFQDYSTVADRYLYLAMLGPALALAWLVSRRPGKLTALACILVLGLAGFQSALQTLPWHSTVTLFTHALEVNPRSWLAHTNLGAALDEQGKPEAAMAQFRQALRLAPHARTARFALGSMLYEQGRTDEAVQEFRTVVRYHPEVPQLHDYLAVALATLGKTAEAQAHWEEALRLDPSYAPAHHNLAASLHAQGKTQEAIAHWREALRIMPSFPQAQRALSEALSDLDGRPQGSQTP